MVGGLLTSVFVLGVCTQMARSVFAAAAAAVKSGAKVSIANFAFAPGEITIALGESVTGPMTMARRTGWSIRTAQKAWTRCCRARALAGGSIGLATTNTIARCILI